MINEKIPVNPVHRHDSRGFFICRKNADAAVKKEKTPAFLQKNTKNEKR